jgi:hypothetical protein
LVVAAADFIQRRHLVEPDVIEDELYTLCGVILATVRLVKVIRTSHTPWAIRGNFHWVLTDARRITQPPDATGKMKLWHTDASLDSFIWPSDARPGARRTPGNRRARPAVARGSVREVWLLISWDQQPS